MAIGALLEDATTNRAKKGLKKLISLAPVQGRRLVDGREEMIPAAQIRPGDLLRILPGEAIPVDGVIQKRRDNRGSVHHDRRIPAGG